MFSSVAQIHLYYFSPSHQLNELCQDNGRPWYNGALNSYGFISETGSRILYAMGATGKPRVGFKKSSTILSEAAYDLPNSPAWTLLTY